MYLQSDSFVHHLNYEKPRTLISNILKYELLKNQSLTTSSSIYRRLSRSCQLVGLVPVFRLGGGIPLRCKASKLRYPLRIPRLVKDIDVYLLSSIRCFFSRSTRGIKYEGDGSLPCALPTLCTRP